jgi:RND family efflux transporter MFP subunit
MLDMSNRHNSIVMHGLHEHESAHNVPRIAMFRQLKKTAFFVFTALFIGTFIIIGFRYKHANALAVSNEENAKQFVYFINPKPGNLSKKLTLPGTIQGYAETPIYSRTSGYVQRWYKDIGDHVEKGDLLAQIDTPEVMQQLAEARAARAQSEANLQLAKSSFERWKALRQKDAVSQQEMDERTNTYNLTKANTDAAEANVQRLTQLLSYNRVIAPFSGLVTKRNVDVGNLVDAGNGGAPKALFSIAQIDPLRLYLQVPESYSPDVQVGMEALVSLSEMPGKKFKGKIVRTAGAIDPISRTLQVEVNIPNTDKKILPGSYASVEFQTKERAEVATWTLPNNAVLFRPEGVMVGVVDEQGLVGLKKITIGRDLGVTLVVTSGLETTDRVIVNPSDSLVAGDLVVAKPLPQPAKPAADPSKADAGKADGNKIESNKMEESKPQGAKNEFKVGSELEKIDPSGMVVAPKPSPMSQMSKVSPAQGGAAQPQAQQPKSNAPAGMQPGSETTPSMRSPS